MKVSEKMTRNVVSLSITATAAEAAERMKSENVGTVLVLDSGLVRGLVTDRQIVTKVVALGRDPAKVSVTEFMTKNPITVDQDSEIYEAAKIMGEQGYRRIPVVENGKPVGIISTADLAEYALACTMLMQNIFKELKKAER
jgi:CBS domain-containing protein